MYIFEINLKNSPSALCHNKEGEVVACVCVYVCMYVCVCQVVRVSGKKTAPAERDVRVTGEKL